MRRFLLGFGSLLLVTNTAVRAAPTGKLVTPARVQASFGELDKLVESTLKKTGVPGASVAVVYGDKVVYAKGYGLREVGKPDKIDADTVFQIASLSKSLGSTVVASIVGDGKVSWDDPVVKWDPGFVLSDPWVTQHVTIADCYSHRTGLPGQAGDDLELFGYDQAEVLRRLRFEPLAPFRAVYAYANFGLTAGGVAAAKGDGTNFADAAERRLFKPAGMASSSYRYADYVGRANKASIHAKLHGKFVPAFQRKPDAQAPAGGASSSARDLGTWMRIELAHGKLGERQLVPATAIDQTHIPRMNSRIGAGPDSPPSFYGLGWGISTDDRGQLVWAHSGAFSLGTGTTVRLFPTEGLGIVVLTNGAPVGAAEAIADSYGDLAFSGKLQHDWYKTWSERMAPLLASHTPERPAHPSAPRALSAYAGSYGNDYYGTATVSEQVGKLVLALGPAGTAKYTLEPFDGDSFLYVSSPEMPDDKTRLTFKFSGDGATSFILAEGLPGNTGTLVRQP